MSRNAKSEQERREQEISMFAAMALGNEWDPNGAAASTLQKKDDDTNNDNDLVITSSASTQQTPTPNQISRSRSAEEDDEKGNLPPPTNQKGRQSWMKRLRGNRDKALTAKEEERSGDSTPRTNTRKSFSEDSQSTTNQEKQSTNTSLNDTNPFAALAEAEPSSGTFAFDSNKRTTSMEKSNLAAAIAAIEKESTAAANKNNNHQDQNHQNIHHIGGQGGGGQSPVKSQARMPPEESASMFAEQVIMPRPLFFGPLVSPRIVRQARQMVIDATKDNKTGAPPRLQDLPGSVRNVVCALKLYGYGIDVMKDFKDGEEFWKGNGFVHTYQPLWDEVERAERVKEIHRQQQKGASGSPMKPSQLRLRSSTAPGRLIPAQKIEGDSGFVGNEKGEGSIVPEEKGRDTDIQSGTAAGESTSEHEANSRSTFSTNSMTSDSAFTTNQSWLGNRQESMDSSDPIQASANEQFTAWIRGDDHGLSSSFGQGQLSPDDDSSRVVAVDKENDKGNSEQELFSQWARGEVAKEADPSTDARLDADNTVSSEQALFSQWARGETGGAVSASSSAGSGSASSSSLLGTELGNGFNTNTFSTMTDNFGGTFQRRPVQSMVDSDDDSVEHDERKKQVGLNDHLSKALASLSEESSQPQPIEVVDESELRLSDVLLDGAKRPLTNYELTNGCVPVYGVDDSPLPVESDLGIHETKEEQQKSQEQKRVQEVVGFVKPNIFSSIACPDPSLNPDDFQSWNARVVGNQRLVPAAVANGSLDNLAGYTGQQATPLTPQQTSQQRSQQSPKQQHSPQSSEASPRSEQGGVLRHQRQNSYGRISRSSEREGSMSSDPPGRPPKSATKKSKHKKKLSSKMRYGWWNVGDPDSWPSTITAKNKETEGTGPVDLDNVGDMTSLYLPPLQHSATTLATVTQLEPFPGDLQKENLPLSRMHAATSMAQTLPFLSDRNPNFRFLQVDTQAVGFPPLGGEVESFFCSLCIYNIETATTSPGGVPVPDLQRCGRISESLHFEYCSDEVVTGLCKNALWPYDPSSPFADILNVVPSTNESPRSQKRIGTRCGVFPVPTNFSFSKLYAVLIVKKVLSDQNVDIYLKGGSSKTDLAKLRENAARAASRQSPFLVPFAFGVAPLLQVFGGSENPVMTSSRAVQIPLFRFSPGNGESQIIDHIMVMLSPREHRSSGTTNLVTPTNGGTAMLVMRNFGYLGLHRVVDGGSSLARDRLVDFSGELQLRRKTHEERGSKTHRAQIDGCSTTLPQWKPEYVAEPVMEGGRFLENQSENPPPAESVRYAQELSPIQLQVSPSVRLPPPASQSTGSRSKTGRGNDVEPFYHTTFCNEMVLHPKMLRACPKGNIVVKAELRELEWNESLTAYVAHLPSCGPSFHNNRRGPFLVQGVLTCCSPRGSEKNFVDEFKLKLPLDLSPAVKGQSLRSFCLFFTAYDVKMGSKNKWQKAKKLFSGNEESKVEVETFSRAEPLASGFFPIARDGCLVDDGIHQVKMLYKSEEPSDEMVNNGMDKTSLILVEKVETEISQSTVDDANLSVDNLSRDISHTGSTGSASDFGLNPEDSRMERGRNQTEPMVFSLRVCSSSSLHSSNPVLSHYLKEEEEDAKVEEDFHKNGFLSKISMGRDLLLEASTSRAPSGEEDRLLKSTLEIVKYSVCPITRSYGFLIRIMARLWRKMVMGTGIPCLAWSNPATPIPLRLHAFASILQLLGGSALFLSKNGLTQGDGTKWSIVSLARVVALCFDEGELFDSEELFDINFLVRAVRSQESSSAKKNGPSRRKRHVRNNFDLYDLQASPDSMGSLSAGSSPSHARRKSDIPASRSSDLFGSDFSSDTSPLQRAQDRADIKIDSKSDFQSALRAAVAAEDDFDKPEGDGSRSAKAMIQAFGGTNTGSRRWMTVPTRALTTIREGDDTDIEEAARGAEGVSREKTVESSPLAPNKNTDTLDNEIERNRPKTSVKQMRIPRGRKSSSTTFDLSSIEFNDTGVTSFEESVAESKPQSVPKTDEEIESAGTAFLDVLGKNLGVNMSRGEEGNAGSSHHRKTRSRSSIDWTLIGSGDGFVPSISTPRNNESDGKDLAKDNNELTTLKRDEKKSVLLPDFADRLAALEKQSDYSARWFPYAYEVVILQWAAILVEQRALGERLRPDRGWKGDRSGEAPDESVNMDDGIAEAATRAIGVAVAGAPLLFEIIKESLGFRINSLFKVGVAKGATWTSPPLVVLDETLFLGLEQVISMVADACIDSRNFDSWELRQMSIDVNDSIISFLRSMFSFLSPKTVHRLILTYISRFVTKEGKHWQDRDSAIGLRCSWEITKLRLNAISGLVRFPDFVKVNSPQMLNWSNWWEPSFSRSDSFFDDILDQYRGYNLPDFCAMEGSSQFIKIDTPSMHSHWLSELCIDICMLGTEHAEPQIQQRSASLLHEMFWMCSQKGALTRCSAPIASMLISFVWKMLSRVDYLSNFAPKSQLRKDLLPCAVYVLQSAPGNLLRAMWRKLCTGLRAKGSSDRYGGFSSVRTRSSISEVSPRIPRLQLDMKDDPDVLDMFSLLNLALRTVEYEGSEEQMEQDGAGGASRDNVHLWQKEFLPSESEFSTSDVRSMRRIDDPESVHSSDTHASANTSTTSRRWFSHDSSLVVINAGHQMVWELYRMLCASPEGIAHLNPSVQPRDMRNQQPGQSSQPVAFTHADISLFVRAASSLYLHALSLRQSDVVIIRTFKISAELIKIFGIKSFLEGVGETLQHWMRVISLQCGARRAAVRIEATDLLELILRSTWHGYGSFFRIRVPLLAVQTEVMERIVATAASRYYRDQRRLGATFEPFSNVNAEASLVPLWRTLDRIEKQPASQNIAFRGALVRIAGKLKKLYRAYIAARVLSYIHGSGSSDNWDEEGSVRDHATEAIIRANRISILRVINASEGHSKQFLGFHATTQQRSRVAHFEAVEDSLLDAADVFSPTELPEHRVAWLRMLADFHAGRGRYAEEATCHFHIHVTLQQASRLHGSLWSNTPFLPWTDNIPDPVYIDVETPAGDPDYPSDFDFDDQASGYGQAVNSFRRIFYRVANSVALNTNEWDTAANRTLFCGITTAQEYNSFSGWSTLRDMEDQMVEHAEHSADLFLKAGIVESSRFAWNLATQFYASKFNYAKLAMAYRNLERCVVSSVPPIDASLPQEVSATLGRFYRVWFHGGAPDELIGTEFVYRTEGDGRLEMFGQELLAVIKSIIPDNTPIHIVLDGRTEERIEENGSTNFFNRLGPTPLEPVRIKITPLRPLFDSNSRTRGLPEWFYRYADEAFEKLHHRSTNEIAIRHDRSNGSPGANDGLDPHHREHGRTYSASVFSSSGSFAGGGMTRRGTEDRGPRPGSLEEDELSGVDKFCFVQPKDRSRSKDWWKNTGSDYADKTLKVTQLQVAQSFPACVARQPVVHRLVYSQSPLEAGIDSVCQWCAVLFRTAVATVGMAVLGTNQDDPGIGTDAVKVVADCIHSSHVKEIGMAFMKKYSDSKDGDSANAPLSLESYDRLSEFECHKLQVKLARLIIVFVELLHLLIARNRQLLLDFMQERKRNETNTQNAGLRVPNLPKSGSSIHDQGSRRSRRGGSSQGSQDTPSASAVTANNAATRSIPVPPVPDRNVHRREASLSDYMSSRQRFTHRRSSSEADQQSIGSTHASGGKGESAIAVQGELQRAFINMAKSLYPKIQAILQGDTPRWLKQCAQDTYFSMGTYKQTTLPIDEELCYTAESLNPPTSAFNEAQPAPYDRVLGSTNTSPRNSVGGSIHSGMSRGSVYSQPQQGVV